MPRFAGQIASEGEDDERVDAVQDADRVHALGRPPKDDLDYCQDGDGEREQDAPLAEPGREGE